MLLSTYVALYLKIVSQKKKTSAKHNVDPGKKNIIYLQGV